MPKLPSSLTWLIDRRARIDGKVQQLERRLYRYRRTLEKCKKLEAELEPLRQLRSSFDQALSQHQIRVDPQLISPIRGRDSSMPYGEITQIILRRLQAAKGHSVSSKEIADAIAARMAELGDAPVSRKRISQRLNCRLWALRKQGRVFQLPTYDALGYGLWFLPIEEN